MPHFSVEYSANLESRYDMAALAKCIADAAVQTGIFPLGGNRVRLYPAAHVYIADGLAENAFVSVVARIGAGRDEATKKSAIQAVAEAVATFFSKELEGEHFLLSLDVFENDPVTSIKLNTINKRLKKEGKI